MNAIGSVHEKCPGKWRISEGHSAITRFGSESHAQFRRIVNAALSEVQRAKGGARGKYATDHGVAMRQTAGRTTTNSPRGRGQNIDEIEKHRTEITRRGVTE
jgi:hypothetical protein